MRYLAQNFWNGFGAAFGIDVQSSLYDKYAKPLDNTPPHIKDAEAIRNDWEQVGSDLYDAIAIVEKEIYDEE